MIMLAGILFGILARFKWGRHLLETYPTLFSFGAVSKDGVPKQKADNTNFELTLVGEGWKEHVDSSGFTHPNRRVTTVVRGRNVGYGATCECMVQAAVVILQETSKLPSVGGVFPPGYAFAETSLVQRLHEREVTFDTTVSSM